MNCARVCRLRYRPRVHRTAHAATAALLTLVTVAAAAPAGALSQGPNAPSIVVNDASIGVVAWTLPQQAAVSDNSPAQVIVNDPLFSPSQYLRATGFGLAIPNGAVIQGIEVAVEKIGVDVADQAARIVKGGTSA